MSRSDRMLLAAIGGAVVLALAAATILLMPVTGETPVADEEAALLLGTPPPTGTAGAAVSAATFIVVDVEGAVAEPGIRELPAGSRVADAIAAAGGYAADVDLAATAAVINLAQALTDGEQVVVPRAGEAAAAAPPASTSATTGGSTGALVNLNTASPEELEALPGIGEVTVQKIVAARQERPFVSLEDAVERGVLNRGQLEDIQGLATAG